MKKLLSVLLTLSMLLTLLIVPISAGGTEPTVGATLTENCTSGRKLIKGTDTTFNGATVIYDLADFEGITSGNYILANDITVGTVTSSLVVTNGAFTLDGNGYSLNSVVITDTANGLIVPFDGSLITVKNLGVNVDSATVKANTGIMIGLYQPTDAAGNANLNVSIDNVCLDALFTQGDAAAGGFIGRFGSGNVSFNNCSLTGDWTFSAAHQGGCYVALSQGSIEFTNCELDVTLKTIGVNQTGGFIGLHNASNLASATFTNCTASGFYHESNTKWLSPFVGSANQTCVITYDSCSVDAVLIGNNQNAAFLGARKSSGTIKPTFKDCSFNGVVISTSKAGALIGNTSGVTVTYDGTNTVSGVVYGGSLVTAKGIEGVTSTNLTESTEATDQQKTAALEAAGVTKTTKGNYYYSKDKSIVGLQTLAAETKAYYQTRDAGENLKDVRVLISVPEAGIASVQGINIEVTFGLTAGGVKTLTVNDKDEKLASYYSVIADSKIAEAGEGYVLLAVVVTGVDTTAWNGTVQVEMTATDENGTAVDGFQITPAGDAVNGNPTT